MTDRRDRVFMVACAKISEKCNFPLQSNVAQRPAGAFLLDGTKELLCYPRDSEKNLIFQLFVILVEMEIKRHLITLVVCSLQSIIDERKTRFQRPETWVLQLHLKDGRYLNPKKGNGTCLRLA